MVLVLALICVSGGILYYVGFRIPQQTQQVFGPPAPSLTIVQQVTYSIQLLVNQNDLVNPAENPGRELNFQIDQGETASTIAYQLQEEGFIRNAEAFRIYLIYSGLDTSIQAGKYRLDTGATSIEIAQKLQDATSEVVTFNILPGWRAEEIAAALPTSGLSISPDDFMAAMTSPPFGIPLSQPSSDIKSLEGFYFPDTYQFKRDTSRDQMILIILQNFDLKVTDEIRQGFKRQGLTLLQGVILASIVQREAIVDDEQPMIASVFLNRLAKGMKLDSDPTVQYALGYNTNQATWWTNPLTANDLNTDSLYNTYVYIGLPPGPICNPSLSALQAVAFPAKTPYYYFRAKCDGSGRHNFAVTLEEQLQNACP